MAARSFISEHSRLTDRQYEAIGRVAAHWSVLEFMLEGVIARLALAPDFPALALTNNLSIENRLEALRNLITMHQMRYRAQLVPWDVLGELSRLPAEIATLKTRRNKIVHYVWFRSTDEKMFGHRFKGKQAMDTEQERMARRRARESGATDFEDGPSLITTVAAITAFAEKVQALADKLFCLKERLPEIDESWLGRSLAQRQRRRRSGIRSARQAPPFPSPG